MLVILSRRTVTCQSVAEVYLTGVTPLRAVSHIFIYYIFYSSEEYLILFALKWIIVRRCGNGRSQVRFLTEPWNFSLVENYSVECAGGLYDSVF